MQNPYAKQIRFGRFPYIAADESWNCPRGKTVTACWISCAACWSCWSTFPEAISAWARPAAIAVRNSGLVPCATRTTSAAGEASVPATFPVREPVSIKVDWSIQFHQNVSIPPKRKALSPVSCVGLIMCTGSAYRPYVRSVSPGVRSHTVEKEAAMAWQESTRALSRRRPEPRRPHRGGDRFDRSTRRTSARPCESPAIYGPIAEARDFAIGCS